MKQLIFSLFFLTQFLFAGTDSENIAKAVKAFRPLAQSGVETVKVKKAKTTKEWLFNLAVKKGYSSDESDFSWVGNSSDAWAADSTNFGSTTMKDAYSYITQVDKEYLEGLTETKKQKYLKDVQAAKDAFKLLLNTGVKFGVAPMGAIQCGVTFAALAIIDPETNTIYLIAREGSGC